MTLVYSSSSSAESCFSYEDSRGVLHFSDEPPVSGKFTVHRFTPEEVFRKAVRTIPKAQLQQLIAQFADRYNMEAPLIEAFVKAESEYDPNAVSRKGAMGLMQLMPATARSLGVYDPHDPQENLRGGIQHLQRLMNQYKGNLDLAAAAYNAGEGAVKKYNGVPPFAETVDYVQKVRKYYDRFREKASRSALQDVNPEHRIFNP